MNGIMYVVTYGSIRRIMNVICLSTASIRIILTDIELHLQSPCRTNEQLKMLHVILPVRQVC